MEKAAIKDLAYGGLLEIMSNRRYFYKSSVGVGYCHFTPEGEKALVEYMNLVGGKMVEAEEASLDKRAKEMVMSALKGSPSDQSN